MMPWQERGPLSLRISVTDRCSFRCVYCMPAQGATFLPRPDVFSYEEIAAVARVMRTDFGLAKVRLTGGEPLLRRSLDTLVRLLVAAGIDDIALTTNGQLLAELAPALKSAGLKRVNVSLDSLDQENFHAMARGGCLEQTLDGIATAIHLGLSPVKINMVVMRGKNDHEIEGLARFGLEHGCEVRFLELMPIGVAAAEFEKNFISSAEIRERLAAHFRLEPLSVDSHDTSRNFRITDTAGRTGTIGFISPFSEPFCAGCARLRLTATGVLMGCLARAEGIPLAPFVRGRPEPDREAIAGAMALAFAIKRTNGEFVQPQNMVGIGG